MKTVQNPEKLRTILSRERAQGHGIGFVPTMGALHEGHLSLVRASNRENDITVVSIFVNPTQFGPKEDYAKYPRTIGADRKLLRTLKVNYLFCPSVRDMYPQGERLVSIKADSSLSGGLCGKFRPGHFQGVAAVVAKLLDITGPCRLYLGAKDYQQTAVLKRLVGDLGLLVRIRVMPTVREKDGLAMSSRNRYLNPEERCRARKISRILRCLKSDLLKTKKTMADLRARAIQQLKKNTDQFQYLEIVDPLTLKPVVRRQRKMIALTACFVGKTRLIDNVIISFP